MDGTPTRKYIVCVHACTRILLLKYSQSEIAANNYPHLNKKKNTAYKSLSPTIRLNLTLLQSTPSQKHLLVRTYKA